MGVLQISILFVAVVNIAVADVFIKKAADGTHLVAAMTSPWMVGALLLYLSQIVALAYFFVRGWEFGSTSMLQLVAYTVVILVAAVVIFGETMTPVRIAGVAMAIAGIALMNVQ